MKNVAVIIVGGSGERLWPLSRTSIPKPFINFDEKGNCLLKKLIERLESSEKFSHILFSTHQDYFYLIKKILKKKYNFSYDFILEPLIMNTSAAIASSIKFLSEKFDAEQNVFVFPADHFINNNQKFNDVIDSAANFINQGYLCLFGIKPSHPSVNYGYIKYSKNNVINFTEKPNKKRALAFIDSKNYLWNSGIFSFQIGAFLKEFKSINSVQFRLIEDCISRSPLMKIDNSDVLNLDKAKYKKLEKISLDYSLIEKTNLLKVIKCNFSWQDLGSFGEFESFYKKNTNSYLNFNSENTNILSDDNKFIATLGLKNIGIVNTHDALLVYNKKKIFGLKELVLKIKRKKPDIINKSKTTHRPWGLFSIIDQGSNYKIKKIILEPKSEISLQYHNFRSEYWFVLTGSPIIILGDHETKLKPGETIKIEKKQTHQLINKSNNVVEIIEIQYGKYLEEDDIRRLKDRYARFDV
jgi:mannose-1-phosphate guanylyltransferase